MRKISLGIPKLNWPKAGDEPFVASKNPRHAARLDMTHRTFGVYACAYKEAADRVVACAIRRKTRYPDFDMFPIGFLYRHYLELILKDIICEGRRCTLKHAGLLGCHDLLKLWEDARTVIEGLFPAQVGKEMIAAENCISKFNRVDASAQEFRYPVDTKQQKTLHALTRVDLRNLKNVMTRLANFLDSTSEAIAEMNRAAK